MSVWVADADVAGPAELLIRELSPADRFALAFCFQRLGERSRYQRYLGAKPTLSPRELDFFVDVDHWHHEAVIAWSPVPRTPVGAAFYVRTQRFDTAEVAIDVVDARQRAGVGRALLGALRERALAAGIRRFTGTLLADNAGALALARQLGPCTFVRRYGGTVEVVVEIGPG